MVNDVSVSTEFDLNIINARQIANRQTRKEVRAAQVNSLRGAAGGSDGGVAEDQQSRLPVNAHSLVNHLDNKPTHHPWSAAGQDQILQDTDDCRRSPLNNGSESLLTLLPRRSRGQGATHTKQITEILRHLF